jgi:hypothetical protein
MRFRLPLERISPELIRRQEIRPRRALKDPVGPANGFEVVTALTDDRLEKTGPFFDSKTIFFPLPGPMS